MLKWRNVPPSSWPILRTSPLRPGVTQQPDQATSDAFLPRPEQTAAWRPADLERPGAQSSARGDIVHRLLLVNLRLQLYYITQGTKKQV